jgi:hypothetical protein
MHKTNRNSIFLCGEVTNKMNINVFDFYLKVFKGVNILRVGAPVVPAKLVVLCVRNSVVRHAKVVLSLRFLISSNTKFRKLEQLAPV